ncbi:MAG TPA: head GIN domain-containing protein [Pyrinomonadaceae bacterium]|nr:head GIN domain-containing protein [Pyrinomonadaceae bacterium]
MKRLACLVLLTVVAAGCHGHFGAQIKGSGKRELQKRQVAPFTSISTEGAFTIEVTCQKDQSVEVEGDDNVLEYVTSDVSGNVLRLKNTKSYSTSEPVKFKIAVQNLEGFSSNGAGRIDIKGMNNEKFEIDANGAPTIIVSGTTKVIDIGANGAVKVDTTKLHASRAVVDTNGASRVDLDVTDQLDATVNGPSTVTYKGDPVVNKTVRGPGKIERRSSEGA